MKRAFASQLLKHANCLLLQETHSDRAIVGWFGRRFAASHKCFATHCQVTAVAECTPLLLPHELCKLASVQHRVLVPGRVHKLHAERDDKKLIVRNIQNHGLDLDETKRAIRDVASDLATVAADPAKATMFIGIDWHCAYSEDNKFSAEKPEVVAMNVAGSQTHKQLWLKVLGEMLEVVPPRPIHYNVVSNTAACIDRIYSSSPAWLTAHITLAVTATRDPRRSWRDGLSDHAPVKVEIRHRARLYAEQKPIGDHVLARPEFKRRLDNTLIDWNIEQPPPPLTSCSICTSPRWGWRLNLRGTSSWRLRETAARPRRPSWTLPPEASGIRTGNFPRSFLTTMPTSLNSSRPPRTRRTPRSTPTPSPTPSPSRRICSSYDMVASR